jgi:hypothetical protein
MTQHFYDYIAAADDVGDVDYDEDNSNNNSRKNNKHNISNDK